MPSQGDVQRLYMQAILSRGIVSRELAQLLWKKCAAAVQAAAPELDVTTPAGEAPWNNFVDKLNRSLDPLNLEFRHIRDEGCDEERLLYGLVNAKGDEVAQMATDYTPAEIAFFRNIIEAIMTAPNESFSVSSLSALREVNNITPKSNMTKAQAEVVLDSFVARGWLLKSKKARYTLSTRSLLELSSYLKQNFPNELVECTICMEMLTRGVACHTQNCQVRMHRFCFAKYVKGKNMVACPTCKADWPKKWNQHPLVPVGEKAARESEENRRRSRRNPSEDVSDGEGHEDEDTPPATQSQPQSQRPKRSQRTRK